MLDYLVSEMDKIPATIGSVIVGSVLALGGVRLANRNSARNLKVQLAHDSKMRKLEREMTLRKEVYLPAAEALAAGFLAVSNLGNLAIAADATIKAFSERATAISKIQIISNVATFTSVNTLMQELTSALMSMTGARIPGMILQGDLKIVSQQLDDAVSDQRRTTELMREENYNGRLDTVRWDAVEQTAKFHSDRVQKLVTDHNEKNRKMQETQVRLSEFSIELLGQLNSKLPPVIIAVREELGMIDLSAVIAKSITENVIRQQAEFANLISEVRAFPDKTC